MILYLNVKTEKTDLAIDHIEIETATGETVSVTWDESDIERVNNGFNARHKGVYFNDEYANGKLESLRKMQIRKIDIYDEEGHDANLIITAMTFDDAGKQYTVK